MLAIRLNCPVASSAYTSSASVILLYLVHSAVLCCPSSLLSSLCGLPLVFLLGCFLTSQDKYFEDHLSLSQKDANNLHMRYYKDYGLAIEGLVRYHKVDPLEYNRKVDDALPLEDIIKPNPQLRKLLEDIDRSKVRLWLFTNAYITHGKRVVRLLEVDDLFEGITYCDYGAERFICKPNREMYAKAMKEAGVSAMSDCYFVGE